MEVPMRHDLGARVYWFTGLSGAGKSTLCRLLVAELRSRGRQVVMLDGDELREVLDGISAYAREDRLALASRYGKLCRLLATQGFDVAIATISLFREVHAWNRVHIPGYLEILLEVPLEELQRRDSKEIYARAANGDLKDVAGVDLPVDLPSSPHIRLTYRNGLLPEDTFRALMTHLDGLT
jgi:cytidine diphosphoramidate kinase